MRSRPIAPKYDMVERFGKSGYTIGESEYSNEGYGTIRLVQDLSTIPTMHSQESRYAGAGLMRGCMRLVNHGSQCCVYRSGHRASVNGIGMCG